MLLHNRGSEECVWYSDDPLRHLFVTLMPSFNFNWQIQKLYPNKGMNIRGSPQKKNHLDQQKSWLMGRGI